MVLLGAAATLGALYYKKYQDTMLARKYAAGRKRRTFGKITRKYKRSLYTGWKAPKGSLKTIQVPRQSRGNVYFPRFNMSPVPRTKHVILNYSQQVNLTGSLGGIVGTSQSFGLNCLFDPDLTGVGHQPMGFDQLMLLWQRYKVYKVEFKLRPIITTGAPFLAAQVQNSQTSVALTGVDYNTCAERSNVAVKVIGDPNESVITGRFTMAEIEGKNIIDDNYSGSVSGNPSNQIKLVLGCGDILGADNPACAVQVDITFYAWLDHKITLAAS